MLMLNLLKDESIFTNAELEIVHYILENPKKVTDMTVEYLAVATYSSPSSIVRLCKKLGMKGYSDFKIKLAIEINTFVINEDRIEVDMPIQIGASIEDISKIFLNLHYQALTDVYNTLDLPGIQKAADAIYNADIVSLFGVGPSLLIAEDFHYKLKRIGMLCVSNSLVGFDRVYKKKKPKNEIAVVISHYGNSVRVRNWVKNVHAQGTKVVMICANRNSPVFKQADYPLLLDNFEGRATKMGSFASRTAMTYLTDCLYAVIFAKDYNENVKLLYETGKLLSDNGEYIDPLK